MLTAVLLTKLRGCLSVRPSSVTFRCFVETNEATIMRFSPSGSKILLDSGEVKIVAKFAGDHTPARGVEACVQSCFVNHCVITKADRRTSLVTAWKPYYIHSRNRASGSHRMA